VVFTALKIQDVLQVVTPYGGIGTIPFASYHPEAGNRPSEMLVSYHISTWRQNSRDQELNFCT